MEWKPELELEQLLGQELEQKWEQRLEAALGCLQIQRQMQVRIWYLYARFY